MTAVDMTSIRLFMTDVDGTLTDGGMYYSSEGEVMKRFNTRDAMGLKLLKEHGVQVGMITAENSQIVLRRAEKLDMPLVFIDIQNKIEKMRTICSDLSISLSEVAYVGDDVNDIDLLKKVGLSFAVGDADARVKSVAQMVLSKPGGHGAVREAAEWLLNRPEWLPR